MKDWYRLTDAEKQHLDYDLLSCFQYAWDRPESVQDEIERVLAKWEGAHDTDDWIWILALRNNKYAYLQAGCDYTGWDCRSWINRFEFCDSPEEAVNILLEANNADSEKYIFMMEQLMSGEVLNWRQSKDIEFNIHEYLDCFSDAIGVKPIQTKRT